jgi:REP element-mobilizing transposase RayT
VRDLFVRTLETVRRWYGFRLIGYAVMPEHVHLLLSEPERKNLALVLQMLKQMVSRNLQPASAKSPFWQARYYDFNVWSEQKRVEKLRYIHRNPVKRGLVERPEDWARVRGSGQECPLYTNRRRESGRDRIALDRNPTRNAGNLSHRPALRPSLSAPPFASR